VLFDRIVGMLSALVLSVVMVACTKAPAGHNLQVAMQDFVFAPESLEVAVGDTVTWVNQGASRHTSTSGEIGAPDGKWDSGVLPSGGSFAYVFTVAGNYHNYCQPHVSMGMKGVVTAK
jgi:plastocyanin